MSASTVGTGAESPRGRASGPSGSRRCEDRTQICPRRDRRVRRRRGWPASRSAARGPVSSGQERAPPGPRGGHGAPASASPARAPRAPSLPTKMRKSCGVLSVLALTLVLSALPAFAQDARVEAAKKEGKVVWYRRDITAPWPRAASSLRGASSSSASSASCRPRSSCSRRRPR